MNTPSQVLPTSPTIHGAMAPWRHGGRQHEFARLEMTNVVVSKHSCRSGGSSPAGSFHDGISDDFSFVDLNWLNWIVILNTFEIIH